MSFKDHFSTRTAGYARYRPGYPPELYEYLAAVAPGRQLAWDCATGNGQAALGLAPHFERVVASDGSLRQLAEARRSPRVNYVASRADASGVAGGACELVTVAQALHWFPFDAFYSEVRRIAAPGAVLAAWTYPLLSAGEPVDALLEELHRETVGAFWPPERRLVDGRYAEIPFPFQPLEAPELRIEVSWRLDHLLGYLRTWSAVRRYEAAHGEDPVAALERPLRRAWGDQAAERRIVWPLVLRVGRIGARC